MAVIFHAKRCAVFAAVESTRGTPVADATLFAAGNVLVQAQDITMGSNPVLTDRKPDGPSLQSIPLAVGQVSASAKFTHRLFTSGAAGTAPSFGPLWKACWMSETVVASTSATYASSPDSAVSLTIGFEVLSEDGTTALRYVMSGAGGSFTVNGDDVQKPCMVSYDFLGAFSLTGGATTTPVGTLTYPAETANAIRFGEFSGTPTGIFTEECDSFAFDRGAKPEMATSITNPNGLLYAMLGEEQPTFKVGYRSQTKAVRDTLNVFSTAGQFANSVRLGSGAGKYVSFSTSASAQFKSAKSKKIKAAWGYDVTIECHRTETSSASNAVTIAFT